MDSPATLLYLILCFLILEYLTGRVLSFLNRRSWSSGIPEEAKGVYDPERYRKAMDYDREKEKLSFWSDTASFLATVLLLLTGIFGRLDMQLRALTDNPVLLTLSFFGCMYLATSIFGLPFSVYGTFVTEERYGFNKTTVRTFILDRLKGYLLTLLIGGCLLSVITVFYLNYPQSFWLYAWAAAALFSMSFAMFYTSLIVPLFNKLRPLEDGALRTSIEAYCLKAGFPLRKLYVMDGSKRSTKANAYFSGLGARKSIVLFDTLIRKHTVEEIVAVLAHEVGHYKKKHILKGYVLSMLNMLLTLYILFLVIDHPALAEALGAYLPAESFRFHLGLVAFAMLYTPLSTLTGLAMNLLSRKNEFEADRFARDTYDGEQLASALKKLSSDHLSNLNPHPANVVFYYSHPPLLQRLRALKE